MKTIEQLQKTFADFIASRDFSGQPEELYAPIAYTILQKGKRMRPVLCLLACEMFDGNIDEALNPALALETFHNFTLIHDDIMDQAPIRRGLETVYKKWNSNIAILSGDAMLAMAFEFALRTPKAVETATLLGKVSKEICEGQQMDLNYETRGSVTIPEYLEMIRLKTAVLLASSLQMGAIVAGANPEDQKNLYDFGIGIGMAFQLQDDILDCYSDVSKFGKMTGGDIIENKKTYMYLKALELASADDRARLEYLFSGKADINPQDKVKEVKDMYDRLHIKEVVESVMEDYYRQASEALKAVNLPTERKAHLDLYANLLSGREK